MKKSAVLGTFAFAAASAHAFVGTPGAGVRAAVGPTARRSTSARHESFVLQLSMDATAIESDHHDFATSSRHRPCERRAALRKAAASVVWGAGTLICSSQSVTADSDAAGKRIVPEDDMEFHQKWIYSKPQDILPYIYATAQKGRVEEILQAMDEFGKYVLHSPVDCSNCRLFVKLPFRFASLLSFAWSLPRAVSEILSLAYCTHTNILSAFCPRT